MVFHILTIFPNIFESYFNESIMSRAQKNNIIQIKIHNLRDWTEDNHKTVDDTPYGGGAGMVMKVEPIYKALRSIAGKETSISESADLQQIKKAKRESKIILLSAKGKTWNQQMAKKHTKLNEIVMICGRYEGIDDRVKKFADEEISVGNYVLTGGEIAAMAVVDSITRLLPGALGNSLSPEQESHSQPGLLEYPQYTRPEIFVAGNKKMRVPKILLSGNHQKIEEWRRKKMKQASSK